ncbi:hypothetical protein H9X57_07585 [Flavobacterium piscinae]|nr:hypothetical protein [Flavobacterium piscinae]MBC8883341.1 hypothetical protein [Flavobacterium piscinae]
MNTKEIVEKQFSLISESLFNKLKNEAENSKKSIEVILTDYIEFDPLFSLSLKDYNSEIKTMFLEKVLTEYKNEVDFYLFEQLFVPHFEHKIIMEIDEVIHSITSRLDSKTQREVQELLIFYDNPTIDSSEFESYIKNVVVPINNSKDKNKNHESH